MHDAVRGMNYKGYTACIEFDERDDIFVGRVLGVRDIISFHSASVAELRTEFHLAVDDYLADCATQGISPDMPAELTTQESADLRNESLQAMDELAAQAQELRMGYE